MRYDFIFYLCRQLELLFYHCDMTRFLIIKNRMCILLTPHLIFKKSVSANVLVLCMGKTLCRKF